MRRIVFRVDASSAIGIGHAARCLTLASYLRGEGAVVSFICRAHDGDLSGIIEKCGFVVHRLGHAASVHNGIAAKTSWLGSPVEVDARQSADVLADEGRPDWLIVDHYGVDAEWERVLRPAVKRLMVIDDLANRSHECDVLLDQNLVTGQDVRYLDKVPEHCRILLGPRFALLDRAYAELHGRVDPRQRDVRRVLVSFGGTDRSNLTARTVAALGSLSIPHMAIDVVVPMDERAAAAVRREASLLANVRVYSNLPTLAQLMAEADLAVGAAGATSWERLCLGLPSLVVTLADNQRPIAESLSQLKLITWLGHDFEVNDQILKDGLASAISAGVNQKQVEESLALVDGRGTERVCSILSATDGIFVRPAGRLDKELLLKWANDPVTRLNSFSSKPISKASHEEWFVKRLTCPAATRIYLAETEHGTPIGQTRFDLKDSIWEIDYSVAPDFRGRRLAVPMLNSALRRFAEDVITGRVRGVVKVDNLASLKVFRALGFESRVGDSKDVVWFERELITR